MNSSPAQQVALSEPSLEVILPRYRTSKRPFQTCSNCVMDTTDSKISFDADGICDHCRNFYSRILPQWRNSDEDLPLLERTVEAIKRDGKGREFDCILGMSGGIDSSYLTYLAKEKLGLRPLVFHVDAGWNTQEAVNNIEQLVDKLGLDLFTQVIDWEEMRDLQLAYFKSGVPHIDMPQDHAFFATMYRFASKYKIKYILTGFNYSTECVKNPREWIYFGDARQLLDIHSRFGQRPLVTYPISSVLRHKVYLRYIRGIKVVYPLNYLRYIKEEAMQLLEEKFRWQRYPQKHFESRFTRFYEGYWLPEKFGFDTRKVQYSSLILTGQMSRSEALVRLASPAYDPESIANEFEYIATKLGISVRDLEGFMRAPNRTYRDYKSQAAIFAVGAWAMHRLGLERVVKR